MRLLITGANGFLGRYVVAEALHRGHAATLLVRSGPPAGVGWANHPQVSFAQADLRSRRGLVEALQGIDAVLHLAAAKSGDLYAQYAGTVVATENLLWAMTQASVRQIVSISSFSVYDYMKMRSGALLTEDSPLETNAFDRDEYAHTKLVQERLVRDHARAAGWAWTILRPGVIYGKDNLFTARLGMQAGNTWVRTGGSAIVPLTYVENCAAAIVLAAETPAASGQTLNVIDDDQPTQKRYANLLRDRLSPRPKIIAVPWSAMRFLAWSAVTVNRVFLKNRAKIPGLLIPARLHARCKPLRFTNERIKRVLGWAPRYDVQTALDRSLGKSTMELTAVGETPVAKPPQPPAPTKTAESKTAEVAA